MMRFNVGGKYLVLRDNAELSYTKKNILFAFDNIECERSTSFAIPKIPENDAIMQMACDIHTQGNSMRMRMPAQMQDGIVTKQGYIYVTEYDCEKKEYSAIFVTGELLKLKEIRDAGKIADYLNMGTSIEYSSASQINANTSTATNNPFTCVKYKQDFTGLCKPSILMDSLVNACKSYFNVNVAGYSLAGVRLLPNALETISKKPAHIESTKGVVPDGFGDVIVNTSTSSNNSVLRPIFLDFEYSTLLVAYEAQYGKYWAYDGTPAPNNTLAGWQAVEDTEITLPDDLPSNIYMVSRVGVLKDPRAGSEQWYLGDFYGGHTFYCTVEGNLHRDDQHTIAGMKIRLSKGDKFAFIDVNDVSCDQVSNYNVGEYVSAVHYAHNGESYFDVGQPSYNMDTIVSHTNEIAVGSTIYIDGNYPDVTFVDLLKVISAIKGKQLYYEDGAGISFIDLDFDTWSTLYLDNIIKESKMSRTFSDYAQKNVVDFDSDSNVFRWERISDTYTISNDSIEEEKTLQTIPFSETGTYIDGSNTVGYQRFNNDGDFGDTDKWAILKCNASTGSVYMSRVSITKNAGVQRLCDTSSTIELSAKMTLHEFEQIKPKMVIWHNGTRYVWVDCKWSKNVATLKLAKI